VRRGDQSDGKIRVLALLMAENDGRPQIIRCTLWRLLSHCRIDGDPAVNAERVRKIWKIDGRRGAVDPISLMPPTRVG